MDIVASQNIFGKRLKSSLNLFGPNLRFFNIQQIWCHFLVSITHGNRFQTSFCKTNTHTHIYHTILVERKIQQYTVWGKCGPQATVTFQWRHNGRDSVSNHQLHDCLLNSLFRCRSKKTSKLPVTGLCAGNSAGTGEFPAQMASYAENVSIWWRHYNKAF